MFDVLLAARHSNLRSVPAYRCLLASCGDTRRLLSHFSVALWTVHVERILATTRCSLGSRGVAVSRLGEWMLNVLVADVTANHACTADLSLPQPASRSQ